MARKQPSSRLSLENGLALLRKHYAGRLKPPLEGLAYRFTIWLPVQSRGTTIFTKNDQGRIVSLFLACCGGCSYSRLEGFPPWSGSWLPEGADDPVIDHHILIVAYALQDSEATAFIQHLKWLLQQDHIAAQEVVLIEQVPVQFVEAAEFS